MNLTSTILLALALMLIIEGGFPFAVPDLWRETFRKIAELPAHQIRFGGLVVMGIGVVLLVCAT